MRMTVSDRELALLDEIWNQGVLELADALFAQDYVNHGGLIPDLIRGPEAIKLSVALYRRAFPYFHISVDDVTSDGDEIAIRWIAHPRRPRTDSPGRTKRGLRGITRCRLLAGKIAESWTVWDRRAALGLLSSRPEASSKSGLSGG